MSTTTDTITVLYVDDDVDFADLLRGVLERERDRFDLHTAAAPSEGLDVLADTAVDCIVSAYDMPHTDGIEFLEAVRADYPDLPFILYTGTGSEEVASEAISAGTTDYLQKESGRDHFAVLANRIVDVVRGNRADARVEQDDLAQAERERYRRRLLDVTSDTELSDDDKIDRLLALGCDRLGLENGHLVAIDRATGTHEVLTVHGTAVVREGVTDLSRTYSRKTIESEEILAIHHAAEDGWAGDPAYESSGLECYIGGTLTAEDRLYGTLCFVDTEPREPFTHDEKAFFNLLLQWVDRIVERRRRLTQAEAVFEHSQDAIFIIDVGEGETFRIRSVNRAYEELTGLSGADLHGRTPRDLLGEDQGAEVEARFRECLAAREPVEYERRLTIDGTTIDFSTRLAPIIEDGTVVQLVGATRDITERKNRERRYDAIFNQTYQFTGLLEPDGTLVEANETALEFGGLDREDVVGMKLWESAWFQHSDETRARARRAVNRAADGEFVRHELPVQGADREVIIDFSIRPVTDDEGTVTFLVPEGRDITERVEAKRELERSERRYRALAENVPNGTVQLFDSDLRFRIAHGNGFDAIDLAPEDLVGTHVDDVFDGELRDELEEMFRDTLAGAKRTRDLEFDGRINRVQTVPVPDESGDVAAGMAMTQDVTERNAEQRKRRRVIQRVTDAIVEVDAEWRFTLVNEQAEALYDMDEAELLGRDFWEVFDAARGTRFEEEYRRVMETRDATSFVEYFSQLDGWFDVTAYPNEDGGIAFYFVDVSEQRERQRELERTNALLSTLFETLPLGVLAESESREVLAVNERLVELLDIDRRPEEVIGADCERLVKTVSGQFADPDRFHWRLGEIIDAREPVDGEELTMADGQTLVRGYRPVELPEGNGHLWVYRDVTERLEHEHRLEALNQATRELLSADTRDGVARVGVEVAKKVIELEANAIHLYEEGKGLVPVGVTDAVYDLVEEPPTFTENDSIAWRVFERGETIAVDAVGEDPDALNPETYIESELIFPIGDHGVLIAGSTTTDAFDQQDVLLGKILVGNIAAALEQVERTEQLRRRERELTHQNDRLNQFASIVSHDLRNPLTVAKGRLELVAEECDSDDLADVEQAHVRMETLIEDLLALARQGETITDPGAVDIAALVEECWTTVEADDATLVAETTPTVRADETRLKQVFENLFRNAVEHGMEDVTITVGPLEDGFYVEDDGPGIPEAEREDSFDPGYTTSDGETGFGLSIVEQVVDAHGWHIGVTEGAAGGARFEITGVEFAGD